MANGFYFTPEAANEPVLSYAAGSPERIELQAELKRLKARDTKIPMVIGGRNVKTSTSKPIYPPHELSHKLGSYYQGGKTHVQSAINAALKAKPAWENMHWKDRAAIFLKAADLLAGPYRAKMNAATMLGQSKNAFQSEIDAVCEFCDFLRFNCNFMETIYAEQPQSAPGIWNRMEYRPLEGFVFAVTPFNFTSIAGNLCAAPALMGNVVVWKPAETQIYSATVIMEIFKEAGLPDGVINMVLTRGPVAGKEVFNHPEFAGLHFTGSTGTFNMMWETIGKNIGNYNSYPRIVGETGGKDFIIAHPSANFKEVSTALVRGAFEYQGQKCSAASRAYIPKSMWARVERELVRDLDEITMGNPEDFSNFVNAVIDEKAYDNITRYISKAKRDKRCKIIAGGKASKRKGYFIEPTVIKTTNPTALTMCEEIFGPVLTIYVYDDKKWAQTLKLVDTSTHYSLTGAVFAKEREAIVEAEQALKHSAGNFYINDKPTGAVVGQQPFGGGRRSGTNDKAGSVLNLFRWISPRTIKENFVPPRKYPYPFLEKDD